MGGRARAQQCTAYLVSIAFQIRRARRALALAFLATLIAAGSASAQLRDESRPSGIFDEVRIGVLAHHIEPAGSEKGIDLNFEILFSRPAIAYGSSFADIALRPRLHVGASINVDGYTSQAYAGFTWDIPLLERVSLELTFGGALHDGQNDGRGSSFGCPLNFRESASLGFAVTERWRLYATVAHMSNGGLCDRNSGLTSGGVRLGYAFE
jgi:lipid A 3-O-deacylase